LFQQLAKAILKSNYALIAENITKYYLELTRNYRSRFDDEVTLLTTAGVLDAQTYVFIEGSIDLDTISHIARDVVSKEISDFNPRRRLAAQERHGMFPFQKRHKSPDDILRLFEDDEFEDNTLLDFVFGLEVSIFKTDCPRFSRVDIELACWKKINTILKAINRMEKRYKGEKLFTLATANLMNSPKFEVIRKQIGIKV
jgi:hypothetical protein